MCKVCHLLFNFSEDGMALSAIDLLSNVAETTDFVVFDVLQRLNSTTILNVLYQLLLDVQQKGFLGRTTGSGAVA
jgi:hypothetical protein